MHVINIPVPLHFFSEGPQPIPVPELSQDSKQSWYFSSHLFISFHLIISSVSQQTATGSNTIKFAVLKNIM
jgi:hypothetical protein